MIPLALHAIATPAAIRGLWLVVMFKPNEVDGLKEITIVGLEMVVAGFWLHFLWHLRRAPKR